MNEDTYREKLTDLQLEVEELRAKLKEAQTGDLISRQAALDALTATAGVGNRALDKIRALPSAQSQQVTGKLNADCISRKAAIEIMCRALHYHYEEGYAVSQMMALSSAQPEIIRCKDCKHQEKFFQKDGRRKDGGYYIYGCELAEGYSHVCLDDDFCSRAERREE